MTENKRSAYNLINQCKFQIDTIDKLYVKSLEAIDLASKEHEFIINIYSYDNRKESLKQIKFKTFDIHCAHDLAKQIINKNEFYILEYEL